MVPKLTAFGDAREVPGTAMHGQKKGSSMQITVLIEELQPGDVLCPDADSITLGMVRDAMAVPTHTEQTSTHYKLQQQAKRVVRPVTVGRLYVRVTMGTYVIVSRRKGTPVSVDRNEVNEPENGSVAVVEAAEPELKVPLLGVAPFNYITSQFRKLGDYRATAGDVPCKVKIHSASGETHYMNIHPDDLAALQEIMEVREKNS